MDENLFDIYMDNPLLNLNSARTTRDINSQLMVTPLQISHASNINRNLNFADSKKMNIDINEAELIDVPNAMTELDLENEFINFNDSNEDDDDNDLTEELDNNIINPNKRKLSDDFGLLYNDATQEDNDNKRVKKPETKWPEELEIAFEEAVNLIPKKSIRNLKIAGSTYGRNQYISFYIKDKTNITRTSKQVSSHIQALTTSKKYPELSLLLKEGPGDTPEICAKFVNIFTEILQNFPSNPDEFISNNNNKNDTIPGSINRIPHNVISVSHHHHITPFKNIIKISFKKFEMSYINFNAIKDSHMFSTLEPSLLNNELPDVSLSKVSLFQEFPIISNIITKSFDIFDHDIISKVPIICGHIRMTLPPLSNDLASGCYNLTTKISLNCLPKEEKTYGMITLISSNNFKIQETFEVLDATNNKSKNDVVFTAKIGNDYWKNYVLNKQKEFAYNGADNIGTREETFELEINSIKIQQFIVHYDPDLLMLNNGILKLDQVNPLEFRTILSWRFEKVLSQRNAITTMKRLNILYNDDLFNSSTPVKHFDSMYNNSKSQNFTPSKSNQLLISSISRKSKSNPFYNDEKAGAFHKTHSVPNIPRHQLDQSGLVDYLCNSYPQQIGVYNKQNKLSTPSRHNNNSFDHSSNSISNNTTDHGFTSNIDNTACTSFSTIDEVHSDAEDNDINIDSILSQPTVMNRNSNNSSNMTQLLTTLTKDIGEPSLDVTDKFSNHLLHSQSEPQLTFSQSQFQPRLQPPQRQLRASQHREAGLASIIKRQDSNLSEDKLNNIFLDYSNLLLNNNSTGFKKNTNKEH